MIMGIEVKGLGIGFTKGFGFTFQGLGIEIERVFGGNVCVGCLRHIQAVLCVRVRLGTGAGQGQGDECFSA